MKKYTLQENDFKQIQRLIKNNTSIYNIYLKMYNLEINNKVESEEYKTLIDYLNISIDVENSIYNELDFKNNIDKCIAWISYIEQDSENVNNTAALIINNNKNEIIFERIFNNLSNYIHEYFNSSIISSVNYISKELKLDDNFSNQIISSLEISYNIDKDILSSTLLLINNHINSKILEEKLLLSKYILPFINKELEEQLIENKFYIPKTININSEIIAELNGLNSINYNNRKDINGLKIVKQNILDLLNIKNIEYRDENIQAIAIIKECFIRSGFIFINDDIKEQLNYEFHEIIDNKDNYEELKDLSISIEIIKKCFLKIKEDKEKIFEIKFNEKRN